MSNYVKVTNFATKDTLPSGDNNKVVRGTEINTEFDNIATAIATKANSADLGSIVSQDADDVTITGGSITGITDITVADGGTGRSALTDNNLLVGNVTSAVDFVAPGTSGNILTSNGTAWTSAAPAATSTGGINAEVFTSSDTFTIPTGVTAVKVTVVGGGGGRSGTGGTSSVASGTETISTVSATGGSSGNTSSSPVAGGAGGVGSGGDLNISGSYGTTTTTGPSTSAATGNGGSSILGGGSASTANGGSYGGGSGGTGSYNSDTATWSLTSGAGGGGAAIKFFTGLTPGNTLTVTVGSGGSGTPSGGSGVVIFEW